MAAQADFVQVDVFTDKPFQGNPLAVFPAADGLSPERMQELAREMNLSETTFVVRPTKPGADYRVRIFTTVTELPYAGHPSVGTAWHLARSGRFRLRPGPNRVHQETLAGVLPIDIDVGDGGRIVRVWTTQAAPAFEAPIAQRDRVARALGLEPKDLHPKLPIQKVSTGLPWMLVPLAGPEALDRVAPDAAAFRGEGALYHNVYPFTLEPRDVGTLTEARGFPMREFEDPVTGSASGCLGAYVAKHGLAKATDGRIRFEHAQGRHLSRPGRVAIDVTVDAGGQPQAVRVGGSCVGVFTGTWTEASMPPTAPATTARPA